MFQVLPKFGVVRAPSARVYKSTSTACTTSTLTTPSFDTVRWDTGSFWSAGDPTKLVFQRAGFYAIGGACEWNAAANGSRYADLYDGTNIVCELGGSGLAVNSVETPNLSGHCILKAAAGSYIQLRLYQDSGSTVSVFGGDATTWHENEIWAAFIGDS